MSEQEQPQLDPQYIIESLIQQRDQANNQLAELGARFAHNAKILENLNAHCQELEARLAEYEPVGSEEEEEEAPPPKPRGRPRKKK